MNGTVFNIQRFSVHDGPGIRTTVFLKGCNLHCFWCHNPESLSSKAQIQYYDNKCIGCRSCLVCENHAQLFQNNVHVFDYTKCSACGKCAGICPSEALILTGKIYSEEEIFNEVKRDAPFYKKNGGVTFSGGEPLLQYEFVAECAELCHNAGFTVAVDTAGNVPYERFERVMPCTDLFLFDIKHHDRDTLRQNTGADLDLVAENLIRLLAGGCHIWIRIPVIPNNNSSVEDITGIAKMISEIYQKSGASAEKVELMPFHATAAGKYTSLGKEYVAADYIPPADEEIQKYYEIINRFVN